MAVQPLLQWLISVMKDNKFKIDSKLLSRDKKHLFKLKKIMDPLLNHTQVKMVINTDELVTREVLFMFKKIQQSIKQETSNLDEAQVASVVKTVEKSEVGYNCMLSLLGDPVSPLEIVDMAVETFGEFVVGLEQISHLLADKIDIANQHQKLVSTMRETETKLVLKQMNKGNAEEGINTLLEAHLDYEKAIKV